MSAAPWQPYVPQAEELHRRIAVVMPYLEYYGYATLFAERGAPQCDLEKLDAAGVRAFGCALTNGGVSYFQVGPNEYGTAGPAEWAYERTKRSFGEKLAEARTCPRVRVVETAADLRADRKDPAIEIIPLITCHSYLTSLEALEEFFRLGLRISHCAGSTCTTWCRAHGAPVVNGRVAPALSELGRAMVSRMNALGVVIDLAHMSDESSEAIIAASKKPVTDGHTSSRDRVPHGRGHSDRVLRRIADSGGVAGIHFADHLFCPRVHGTKYPIGTPPGCEPRLWKYNRRLLATVSDPEQRFRLRKDRAAQDAFYRENHLPPDPEPPNSRERIATLADMADHVEHMVRVMGIEHVGLGGDVNGIEMEQWPLGMDHVGELPHLSAELLRRGWREEQLEKFLSTNWLRVYRECLP